ncbi:MAG TPA: hypothetical protein VHO49_08320 [Anaerolineales bacterium]|nr:hypothetical protein [Anaerolineales bacterium]
MKETLSSAGSTGCQQGKDKNRKNAQEGKKDDPSRAVGYDDAELLRDVKKIPKGKQGEKKDHPQDKTPECGSTRLGHLAGILLH